MDNTTFLLSKLAAMAPAKIPGWFVHIPAPKPQPPIIPAVLSPENRDTIKAWLKDGSYDLPEDLRFYQEGHEKYVEEYYLWERKESENRLRQWMALWAKNAYAAGNGVREITLL